MSVLSRMKFSAIINSNTFTRIKNETDQNVS